MRVADHQQVELFDALLRLRYACHGVAAVAHDEHRLNVVLLAYVLPVEERGVEPPGRWNAGRVHRGRDLAVRRGGLVEAIDEPLIVDLPDARPVAPGAFDQAVVERQRHDIEAEIGGALHIGVAAEDVGALTGAANIAGGQQQDAARAHVGRADRVLSLTHRPNQTRRLFSRKHLGDALELCARHAADALDFRRIPLLDRLADVVHPVDALFDELLVFPAVLEDVPEHSVDDRNVGTGTQPHIFRSMRGGAGEPRIGDDEVRAIELLAFEQMLERHWMRLGRITAEEEQSLRVADVGVAVSHRAVAPGIGHAGNRR